tara:strand:- start:708 stop:1544 length:837 start_codon:yes stop_codon:yes gene_type:complete
MKSEEFKGQLWIHLGPGKSGSTWIYNIAKSNPNIFTLPIIKETQAFHFSSKFNNDFYKLNNLKSKNIFCDFSNTYFFNPISISNLKKYRSENINTYYTTLMRCPLKRTLSHYKYLIASGEISNLSFRDLMGIEPSILWRSRYDIHIEYIKNLDLHFKPFVLEEQNSENPEIIRSVLNYFNIQEYNLCLDNIDKFESRFSRNYFLTKTAKSLAKYLRNKKYYNLLEALKSNVYIRDIFMKREGKDYDICNEDISSLRSYFSPVKEYCNNLGLNVSKWLL